MKEGLEGVVEFLLPELAFAGEQGLSVGSFIDLTRQYAGGEDKAVQATRQGGQNPGTNEAAQASTSAGTSTTVNDTELGFARGAWKWLVSRPNVLIGGNRRWNKLSLDEVLALPETKKPLKSAATPTPGDTPATGSIPAVGATPAPRDTPLPEATYSQTPVTAPKQRGTKSKSTLTTRPRITVTEETVWQAIAGHGIDYKQIPKLEWVLLQGIAPTKHDGILQGDLRRLVGQDKRSVPKRTDFLAAKGYIVKRSIMIRASKTSKLWLTAFAPSTTETSEESAPKDIKMTKETLIRDLSAVPWHAKWTGADIDVETFAESAICIVKAWGVMRYSDLRQKMGVDELRWQMRVLARLTRNLVDMGIIKYTAATFSNSRKVWKDCVKFIRDPTEAEWAKILATGKKTSKYTDLSKDRQPKPFALSMADKSATPQMRDTLTRSNNDDEGATPSKPASSSLAGWVPEKPLAQTLFDAIDAAGPTGATNPQISAGTVGYNFRRYVGTMLTNMAMCRQPPHLQKFQLDRVMVRVDKTSAFIYTTNQGAQSKPCQGQLNPPSTLRVVDANGTQAETPLAPLPGASVYGFAPIQQAKLANPSASLSEISRKLTGRHRQHLPPKRPLPALVIEETPGPDEDGRPSKRRRVDDDGGYEAQPNGNSQVPASNEKLAGKPPGAYIGEPGSLNPNQKRNGRPRKSLVVIFKSEKLKDPAFFNTDWIAARNPDETVLSVQYNGIAGKLCLNRLHKTVIFSRQPQPPGKEPLTVQLDDLHDEPVIRPVPGCDDNSLVFVTKENGENPSWTYVFLFKDDTTSQQQVDKILKWVKCFANGEPFGDEKPKPAETRTADKVANAAPASPAVVPGEDTTMMDTSNVTEAGLPAIAKGKAKAKGKGRGKRNAPGSSQKPWKCEKCGGVWKNDIGLKYHLTKARVPCNPDFVAKAADPASSRKQSRKPPVPPEEPVNEAVGGNEGTPTTVRRYTRQAGSSRPRKRFEPKLEHTGAPTFRGLTIDDSYLSKAEPVVPPIRTEIAGTELSTSFTRDEPTPTPKFISQVDRQRNGISPVEHFPSVIDDPTDDTPVPEFRPLQDTDMVNDARSIQVDDVVRGQTALQEKHATANLDHAQVEAAGSSASHMLRDTVSNNKGLPQHEPLAHDDFAVPAVLEVREEAPVRHGVADHDVDTQAKVAAMNPKSHAIPQTVTPFAEDPEPPITPKADTPAKVSAKEPKKRTAPKQATPAIQASEVPPTLSTLISTLETTQPQPTAPVIQPPETHRTARKPIPDSGIVRQTDDIRSQAQIVPAVTKVAAKGAQDKETPRVRRPLPDKPTKRHQDQQETGTAQFTPSTNYVHLSTDSKMRTAQAIDIVEYLLENNGGIFPGDKALFYAVLKIYLKAFKGQTPPSFKNLQVACKRLMTKGKATETVYAFRHSTGKFVTCTMLLSPKMDANSIVPTILKKKMQDAYPGVFIPPAFSPSKEELRLLEEFDGEPVEVEEPPQAEGKFRGRRVNMEVEVMNAPFYQENPFEVGGQAAPSVPSPVVNEQAGVETPKRRRKRAQPGSVPDQPSGRAAKKQKTLGSKLLSIPFVRKKDGEAAKNGSDREAEDLEQANPQSKESRSPEPEATSWGLSTMDNTPVANAIKAYGLLPPPRAGTRKRRFVDNLRKLPEEVGRARNPGLSSLPYFFFTNKPHEHWSKHTHSTRLQFLEPNTRLDDYHDKSWFEELGEGAFVYDTSSVATDNGVMSSTEAEEPERIKEFSLVPLTFVREISQGVWPDLPMSFFQKYESVHMLGWSPSIQYSLRLHLPTNINEMASWNKRRRVNFDLFKDRALAEFSELIDRCEGWELSEKGIDLMTFGTVAPNYIFMDASPPSSVCSMKPVEPIWVDQNQYTMETMPYELAADMADGDEEPVHKEPKLALFGKKPRGRPPGKKESPKKDQESQEPREKKRVGRKPKRIRLPALEVEREGTAYPQSAEEYMDIHHGTERSPEWNSEHTQLAAFVCVTTLLGGVAKSVDWGLMMRLFPDMSLSHLRKFFGEMNKDRKSTIIDLTEKFQKAFLEAYEKGELPPLDYENVLAYDWKALTVWTRGLAGDESTLPPSYADLEQRDMIISDRTHQPRDWRETFWLPARSLYNRYQDSSSQAFAMAIDAAKETEDGVLTVAMSWVRALCVTPPHPPEVVSDKWETFMGLPRDTIADLIDKSIRILQERLVITKDKNLIVMRLNDRVVKALDKAAQDLKFTQAAHFKRSLDRAFRKGEERKRIPYVADDDGMTLAVLNLQAHNRITVETDNKYVPLGYEPFNYETRKFDRKYHHFRLFAVPTEDYVYSSVEPDHDETEEGSAGLAILLQKIRTTSPPRVGPLGEIPLWIDFFGKIDEVRWRKCLGGVLFILSTRGPMKADAIAEQLKCVMAFEAQMVLDWADRLGLMEQMTPGAPKCVTEWWWLAVDAQMERVDGTAQERRARKEKEQREKAKTEKGNGRAGKGEGSAASRA